MADVTVKTHTSVRTTQGTIPANTRAGLPEEEAERYQEAGLLMIIRDDGDQEADTPDEPKPADVPEDYNELRSVAADLEERTGIEPDDYKKATLTEYVKKHGE